MPIASADVTSAPPAGKELPPKLAEMMAGVSEISSLPEITTKIVEVVEDPDATAHDMHDVVRTDPALAAKVLKVVNSAFYGLPSQIASLDRAILMLGLSAVKNIALAASLSRMFSASTVSGQQAARDLWRHSVAVAVCGKMLGERGKAAAADEAFVGGLVHDLGLISVQQLFPEQLKQVMDRCRDQVQDFCAVEVEVIGADHQVFGNALAVKWKFPASLRHAIAYHHDPHNLSGKDAAIPTLTRIADILCCRAEIGRADGQGWKDHRRESGGGLH